MHRRQLAAIAFLGAMLPAQASLPVKEKPTATPPKPLLTLEVAGPGALRDAFLATNVGNLIGGDDSKAVWTKFFRGIAAVWDRTGDANARDSFTPFRKRFAEYRGRMRFRLFVTSNHRPRDFAGIVELLPDGKTDLQALSRDLNQLLGNAAGNKTSPVKIGDLTIAVIKPRNELSLSLVHRDRVVLFVGDIENGAFLSQRVLTATPIETAKENRLTPIALRFDLSGRMELTGWLDTESNAKFMEALFHVSNLEHLDVTIRPFGPHVRLDLTVSKKLPEQRGILGAFLARSKTPPDLRRLPRPRRFSTMQVSYETIWNSIIGLEAAGDINQFLGFDVKAELVDNLRPGLTILGDDWANCCLVFGVKDGTAVRGCFRKLFDLAQIANPEISQHRGVAIHTRPTPFDHECHVAQHQNRLLIALGDRGREFLEATIDAQMQKEPNTDLPQALTRTTKSRPPGCNGLGVISAQDLHKAIVPMLFDELMQSVSKALPDSFDWKYMKTQVQGLAPMFVKHRLDDIVWYAGQDDRRLYVRFVW